MEVVQRKSEAARRASSLFQIRPLALGLNAKVSSATDKSQTNNIPLVECGPNGLA